MFATKSIEALKGFGPFERLRLGVEGIQDLKTVAQIHAPKIAGVRRDVIPSSSVAVTGIRQSILSASFKNDYWISSLPWSRSNT